MLHRVSSIISFFTAATCFNFHKRASLPALKQLKPRCEKALTIFGLFIHAHKYFSKICVWGKGSKGLVPNLLNRLCESKMLSSIFPKYAVVMFVIDLRKSFLFMLYSSLGKGYKNIATQFTS